MAGYAFIGDVHSQVRPLEKALNYCGQKGLTPVLLGDIFDSMSASSDSVAVYNLCLGVEKSGGIILRSNHQFLLESLANRREVPFKRDFCRTIEDFQKAKVCIREVGFWLETFPYMVVFRNSSGVEYRAAHAEIPDTISVPEYEGIWKFFEPSLEEQKLLLWGRDYQLPDAERFWWRKKEKRDWVCVAGHYHRTVVRKNAIVLDSGCGGRTRSWFHPGPPALALYDTENQELKEFSVLPQ